MGPRVGSGLVVLIVVAAALGLMLFLTFGAPDPAQPDLARDAAAPANGLPSADDAEAMLRELHDEIAAYATAEGGIYSYDAVRYGPGLYDLHSDGPGLWAHPESLDNLEPAGVEATRAGRISVAVADDGARVALATPAAGGCSVLTGTITDSEATAEVAQPGGVCVASRHAPGTADVGDSWPIHSELVNGADGDDDRIDVSFTALAGAQGYTIQCWATNDPGRVTSIELDAREAGTTVTATLEHPASIAGETATTGPGTDDTAAVLCQARSDSPGDSRDWRSATIPTD